MSIAKGALAAPRLLEVMPLTREDLELLREPRATVTAPVRFRDAHHNVARLLALGMGNDEAADRCGYSVARIAQLVASPAFQQLIAIYRVKVNEKFEAEADEFLRLATSNMMKAQRTIAEHFDKADEEDELIPLRTALAVAADTADRLGYGKKQTNLNINVDFAAQLERAITRSSTVITLPSRPVASGPRAPEPLSAPSAAPAQESPPLRRRFA